MLLGRCRIQASDVPPNEGPVKVNPEDDSNPLFKYFTAFLLSST